MSPSERRLLTVAAWLAGLTLVVMVGVRPAWRTLQTVPTQMQTVEAVIVRTLEKIDSLQRTPEEVMRLRRAIVGLARANQRHPLRRRVSSSGDEPNVQEFMPEPVSDVTEPDDPHAEDEQADEERRA